MKFRYVYLFGFFVCVLLLGEAYYLQYRQQIQPCPLCIIQRLAYYVLAIILLIATVHYPCKLGQRVYALLIFAVALIGAGFAARQVFLQQLPLDTTPPCTPNLIFMLHHFPLQQTLMVLFYGSGDCAVVHRHIFGLTLAWWSLLFFVAFSIAATVLFFNAKDGKKPQV